MLLDEAGIDLSALLAILENSIDAFAGACPSLVDGLLEVAVRYSPMNSAGPSLAAVICPVVKVRWQASWPALACCWALLLRAGSNVGCSPLLSFPHCPGFLLLSTADRGGRLP